MNDAMTEAVEIDDEGDASDKLSQRELVEAVVTASGLSRQKSQAVLTAVLDTMANSLRAGRTVRLRKFGTLSVVHTPARQRTNPNTGETRDVPEGTKVRFKPSKALRESLPAA